MKDKKFKIGLVCSFTILITLYLLSIFGFSLRLKIPTDSQFILSWTIFALFIVFVLLSIRTTIKLTLSRKAKPYVIIALIIFLVGNNIILDRVSFCNRENEVTNYLSQNESKLLNLIGHYQKSGTDKTFYDISRDMNLESFSYINGEYHIGLYSFFGYGYRLLHTEKTDAIKNTKSPEGSPTVKWFKIKEHWYYYSFWD
ncbi:MAG: hypothetical protein KKA07_01745 [Bacteroidetes bacterium]|nr:hypothetical protein [Bacteroidota bacterium]MBU1717773.1 hypothetical protein [Bacteroidota bacterium]